MRAAGHQYDILSPDEISAIVNSALRILSEMGMEIQNPVLLQQCAEHGWKVDLSTERVRFPTPKVKAYIEDAAIYDWSTHIPWVKGSAGVYHGRYLDPSSRTYLPWTEEILSTYFALARHLSYIDGASMLGCRLPVFPPLEPLYERYYCWKHGAQESGSLYLDALCPYVLELYGAYAHYKNKPIQEVFNATVYVIPHLKLGYHEAAQVQYFWERGLKVNIGGGMPTMGGTAPVTFAGAITLNLAEQLALNIIDWTLFGIKNMHIGASISVMDMRTSIHPFGRPEMAIANLMTAQLSRYRGASFSGHAGLTDAKRPSVEAGCQKMMTAIPTLLAGGSLWVDAGLLSSDEVYSPVQMILDNEMLSALDHLTREFAVDDKALGLDTVFEVGPGGHYMDRRHTVEYFRREHWQPGIWSRQMLNPWIENGSQIDADKARDIFFEVSSCQEKTTPLIPDSFEKDMMKIINHARLKL